MKNIKYFLTLQIFLFLGIFTVNAQTGYTEGTTWHYGFILGFPPVLNHTYQVLTIDGDTIINENYFQQIISQNWDMQTPFSTEYVRKENNKVYWFDQQNGITSILYNFAAEPGENWTISINDCELLVVVDSVNYSTYNGVIKKNLYVTDYFTGWDDREYVGACFKGKIIEDIGHTVTFFPHRAFDLCEGLEVDGIDFDDIRCYEDNSFYFNFKGYSCDTTWMGLVSVNSYEKVNTKIYPNPVNEILTIETDTSVDIIITDMLGKIISEKYKCEQPTYFDTSKWKTGIYFVNVYSKRSIENSIFQTFKIIKS
jgi:hypothetical protein